MTTETYAGLLAESAKAVLMGRGIAEMEVILTNHCAGVGAVASASVIIWGGGMYKTGRESIWACLFRLSALLTFSVMSVGAQSIAPADADKVPATADKAVSLSVVSVKPSAPGADQASYQTTQDSIVVRDNPLWNTISIAYGIEDERALTGLPDWAMHERFDIIAKIEEADLGKFSQLQGRDKGRLLQSVLMERFGLKSHTETREFPVWALVVAKGGPKLTPATGKSEAGDKLMVKLTGDYRVEVKNASMQNFCHMILSTEAQQLAVDETHLDDKYDFTLSWTRPGQEGSEDAPDIFTAVKQQLGLELVKRTVPETVLVVDEIHRPTPN